MSSTQFEGMKSGSLLRLEDMLLSRCVNSQSASLIPFSLTGVTSVHTHVSWEPAEGQQQFSITVLWSQSGLVALRTKWVSPDLSSCIWWRPVMNVAQKVRKDSIEDLVQCLAQRYHHIHDRKAWFICISNSFRKYTGPWAFKRMLCLLFICLTGRFTIVFEGPLVKQRWEI